MKKIFSLIFLSMFTFIFLTACSGDVDLDKFKNTYNDMTKVYVVEDKNIFFSDSVNPNTISLAYSSEVQSAMNNINPTTDMQKKYRAFYYQQMILNNIFNFYEDNKDNFYLEMSNKNYKDKELEYVYDKLVNLKNSLGDFKSTYDIFMGETLEGLSDVLEINLKNYTFELNCIIEDSFDFIYSFMNLYNKYCIPDEVNAKTLEFRIDKAYVDVAHIIYLENFKSFNLEVGADAGGICDLADLIGINNQFNLLKDLTEAKSLSANILANLDTKSLGYLNAKEIVDGFIYYQNLFDQNYYHYITTYNSNNMYDINQYRFELVGGISYESYLNSLSVTDKSKVNMLTSFIDECYNNMVLKLKLIVN